LRALKYFFGNKAFVEKVKLSNGKMIDWQNNCAIILPKNYSA
jgi:hypothetical protein